MSRKGTCEVTSDFLFIQIREPVAIIISGTRDNEPHTHTHIYIHIYRVHICVCVGFAITLELNLLTLSLKTKHYSNASKFSNLQGSFPIITHCLSPYLNLAICQKSAPTLFDLIRLEKTSPKFISQTQITASSVTSKQIGLIKVYLLSFLLFTVLVFRVII